MTFLSHSPVRLSISLALAALMLAGPAVRAAGPSATSPYYGRWTVSEDRPVFTARGRVYKTVDIAPCGKDFCGVSVSDAGACGPTLFRFLAIHSDGESTLHGHARWGTERKNVQIDTWADSENPEGRTIELYLGDGYDFGERSGNMPKFHAAYRHDGAARCRAR